MIEFKIILTIDVINEIFKRKVNSNKKPIDCSMGFDFS